MSTPRSHDGEAQRRAAAAQTRQLREQVRALTSTSMQRCTSSRQALASSASRSLRYAVLVPAPRRDRDGQ